MTSEWIKNLPWPQINKYSIAYNLDQNLIAAIIQKESAGRPKTARVETVGHPENPKVFAFKHGVSEATEINFQFCSWGVGQVMGYMARRLGFDGWLPDLCDVDLGVLYTSRVLDNIKARNSSLLDIISIYNAGAVHRDPITGLYKNQGYVNVVRNYLEVLQTYKRFV